MPEPRLLGYTLETVIAEKLESIVKLAMINTRMKDFYDLWSIFKQYEINSDQLQLAITKVFANRKTAIKYPIAFSQSFFEAKETKQRWNTFLSSLGKDPINFNEVIQEISIALNRFFKE